MRCVAGSNSVITFPWRFLRQLVQFGSAGLAPPAHAFKTAEHSKRKTGNHPATSNSGMALFAKASTLDERSARLAGIGLMLFGVFMFSFGDALGKFLVGTYSVGQLLWLRACAALVLLFPLMLQQRCAFARLE